MAFRTKQCLAQNALERQLAPASVVRFHFHRSRAATDPTQQKPYAPCTEEVAGAFGAATSNRRVRGVAPRPHEGLRPLDYFLHLRNVGDNINRRLPEVKPMSQSCALSQDTLDPLQLPRLLDGGQRGSELRFARS